MLDERFYASERFGKRKYFGPGKDLVDRSIRNSETDHASKSRELFFGERVRRMRRKAGIIDFAHGRMLRQKFRDLLSVGFVLFHADGQRLDPAEHEPRIERAGRRPEGIRQIIE